LRESQPHLSWSRKKPFHLEAQAIVFFDQQLLTFQQRLQALRKLALKDPWQVGQQGFQFCNFVCILLALEFEPGR
tara:strand:+ start:1812 stop:2036 length:225 start_codon:yes stop_codon:yes gene_type:complete